MRRNKKNNIITNAAKRKVKRTAMSILKNIILAILPYVLFGFFVFLILFSGYYFLFETKGTEQKYTYDEPYQNEINLGEGGFFKADRNKLSSQNNAVYQFYKYISGKSFWQITGDDNKKLEQTEGADAVRDYFKREEQFYLNPNLLFALDEFMYQNRFKYPEQFTKPVYYDDKELTLKDLAEEDGTLTAESTERKDGKLTKEKVKGVWDYGLASIYKYKEDERKLIAEGNYTKKDVWDNESKKVKTINIEPQPFKDMQAGFPEKIWIMIKAITFIGEFEWDFEVQRQEVKPLVEGVGTVDSDKIKIYYDTYKHYESEPCNKTDPKTGKTVKGTCKVLKGTYKLYKYRSGSIYEYLPTPVNEKVNKKGDRYIRDFLYNFKTYLPESVMIGFDFTERVGQLLNTTLDVGSNADMNNPVYYRTVTEYGDIVAKWAAEYNVDPNLIIAKICQESNGNPAPSNGQGLMQISYTSDSRTISATNKSGTKDSFTVNGRADREDPEKAIRWGVMYFANKLEKFEGDELKALQSYNFDISIIKDWYPESWDSLEWMNHREEVRLHYGGNDSRSVSYDCAPQWAKSSGKVYGDVCYIEHVLRWYSPDGAGGYKDLEGHDQETGWEKFMNGVKSVLSPKYSDDEKYNEYIYKASPMEVDWALKTSKVMEEQTLFSEPVGQTLNFWDAEFITAFTSKGMSYSDTITLIPGLDGYVPPLNIAKPIITSKFGYRIDPLNGKPGAFHTGVDVAVPTGTPIIAMLDGEIVKAVGNQRHSKANYGNYVKVKHSDGTEALYAHLDEVFVEVGDAVTQGQVIGKTGTSGRSTGPHLHFEFFINGQRTDPYHLVVRPQSFAVKSDEE